MKKLFSLLILVVLFGICATVPGKLRQADAIYEQRIVALVDIVEGSLKSVASSGYLEIDVYAPKVAWQENRDLFTVTGIVGLSAPDGSEFFETFAANVGNGCEGAPRPDCARVQTQSRSRCHSYMMSCRPR